jgi:serpin B
MSQQAHYGYVKEAGFTAVSVPYSGGDFQLLIVLPAAKDGLAVLEKTLTSEQLVKLAQAPTEQAVKLFLPKFKMEPPTLALAENLKTLGMKAAFDSPKGSADFSRMAKRASGFNFAISDVFHKTYIAIDEEGTEAAAATAVAMTLAAGPGNPTPPPVEVRVDRPFLFAIQHRESGTCLFLGRISDPRSN